MTAEQRHPDGSVSIILRSFAQSRTAITPEQWNHHFPRLVKIAHAALAHLPHRVEDAHDAAQSALVSFWQRMERDGFEQTLDRNSLWRLLATITTRKAQQVVRKEFAQKRGGGKVMPFADAANADGRVSHLLAHVPTTDFDLECAERVEKLPEELRPFALLRLFSHTNAEIAEIVDCSERRVERKLQLIRSYWSRDN